MRQSMIIAILMFVAATALAFDVPSGQVFVITQPASIVALEGMKGHTEITVTNVTSSPSHLSFDVQPEWVQSDPPDTVPYQVGPGESMTIRLSTPPRGLGVEWMEFLAYSDLGFEAWMTFTHHSIPPPTREDIFIDFDAFSEGTPVESIKDKLPGIVMSSGVENTTAVRDVRDFDVVDTMSGRAMLVAGEHKGFLIEFDRMMKNVSFKLAHGRGDVSVMLHYSDLGGFCSSQISVGASLQQQGQDTWRREGFFHTYTYEQCQSFSGKGIQAIELRQPNYSYHLPFLFDEIRMTPFDAAAPPLVMPRPSRQVIGVGGRG